MKSIKIANYSVYSDGWYNMSNVNFTKLYKGVRVNVDINDQEDHKYIHFSIRTNKARTCIWKRSSEKMNALIFDDKANSITCDFENEPKNKCPHTLSFAEDVYNELKENIPAFMKECGVKFSEKTDENGTVLIF